MSTERACRVCRHITTNPDACPVCGSKELTEAWSGFIIVINPEISELAKELGIKVPGKYAVKIK